MSKILLKDMITKNYHNISYLDIDMKKLANDIIPEQRKSIHCFRSRSYKTIDDSFERLGSNHRLNRLPSRQHNLISFNSEIKYKPNGFQNKVESIKKDLQKQFSLTKYNNSKLHARRLHRFLFQIKIPSASPQQRSQIAEFRISTTTPLREQDTSKYLRRISNKSLNKVNHHMQQTFANTEVVQNSVNKAYSVIKVRRKTKVCPANTSKLYLPSKYDFKINPDITKMNINSSRCSNRQKKQRSRVLGSNQKIKVKRELGATIKLNDDICGWGIEQM